MHNIWRQKSSVYPKDTKCQDTVQLRTLPWHLIPLPWTTLFFYASANWGTSVWLVFGKFLASACCPLFLVLTCPNYTLCTSLLAISPTIWQGKMMLSKHSSSVSCSSLIFGRGWFFETFWGDFFFYFPREILFDPVHIRLCWFYNSIFTLLDEHFMPFVYSDALSCQ